MKAVLYERYGGPEVLQLKDLPIPAPKDHEVLIRLVATTVTSADCRIRSLTVPRGFKHIMRLVFGWAKPRQRVLGMEFSGIVELVGKNVGRFKVGDEVFGFSDKNMGCYAEYKGMPEHGVLTHKPSSLSHFSAAALSFGGTTALDFFRRGRLKDGEKVLIHGASGSVGTAAIQLAKHRGAEVTAVCSSANLELVKSLGADHVIDYQKLDFRTNGKLYDVILDTVGTVTFANSKSSLNQGGRLLAIASDLPEMLKIPFVDLTTNKKVIAGPASATAEDLKFLAELAVSGGFKPVIGAQFAIEQIVDAHTHVDQGHKRGNVIVTMGSVS